MNLGITPNIISNCNPSKRANNKNGQNFGMKLSVVADKDLINEKSIAKLQDYFETLGEGNLGAVIKKEGYVGYRATLAIVRNGKLVM